jgi:hypothetical protein
LRHIRVEFLSLPGLRTFVDQIGTHSTVAGWWLLFNRIFDQVLVRDRRFWIRYINGRMICYIGVLEMISQCLNSIDDAMVIVTQWYWFKAWMALFSVDILLLLRLHQVVIRGMGARKHSCSVWRRRGIVLRGDLLWVVMSQMQSIGIPIASHSVLDTTSMLVIIATQQRAVSRRLGSNLRMTPILARKWCWLASVISLFKKLKFSP